MATMLATAPAQAAGPTALDPSKPHYGMTYAEWSAAWWQWAFSIPVHKPPKREGPPDTINHPLVEDPRGVPPLIDSGPRCGVGQQQQAGGHEGQSGPVWFLGGAFFQNNFQTTATVSRHGCTVPSNIALFFPLLNPECSRLEGAAWGCPGKNGKPPTVDDLRADIVKFVDATDTLQADITDSHRIKTIFPVPKDSHYRVKSPSFSFSLAPDDILTWIAEGPFNPGTYSPAVGDGYYVMLAPLSPGTYALHFKGASSGFSLEVNYTITVVSE